ncbi:probable plastidic glucose transporter 2 isoform X2 [Ananas comosus]|uniref:Probable plastidic glucose transporter 2 isoform X2 n=1 Tax=Ananas comosus TaxID=4615 RepID=A0A6P5F5T5_ANACO|nr:probable plastidic glucose transporter 2 isoform X2 [Ananas comosus]
MMHSKFNSSAYKRMSPKELTLVMDRDDESPVKTMNCAGQDDGNPSWRRSLPHVCVATITSFLFGYHVGVVNEPLESISLDLGFAGNTMEEGLVVSMCLGGAFFGCLFSGWIADGIGRRRAFQLSALPMIFGACLSASATSLEGMLAGRFLVGMGMGLGPPVASLYVTEVSPSSVRGTYGSFIQIATCLGLIGALLIGIPVKEYTAWWRVCFWVATVPAVLLAILMEFCAESPLWLYKRGRITDAEVQFERLLGGPHVKSAIAELSRSEKADEGESVRYSELFYGRHFRGSIIAMLLMDKLGRKVLLFGSFLGMATAMGLQSLAGGAHFLGSGALYLSVGGMLLFVLAFSLGAGPVPGLLLPEIFSNKIRAKAMALCMSVHWVVNFFVGLLFLQLLEQLGAQVLYSIFAAFCLIAAVFVKKNVLETKGKTLQEIEVALLSSE